HDALAIEDVFSDLIKESGEPALLLKGLRHKEGLTQIQFAQLIRITQTNLSAMENGRRKIGKDIAKRIAKKFSVDYRLFL
ncbi:MAG: helix-turn-helix transcriptional regulator, partial [Pseudomonadota bacterium]